MTYPPQQPGPYGQDPYGQQSGQFGQQPPGQQPPGYPGGFGGYPGGPGEPPKKKNTGTIVAVIVAAVLVLGGAATGIYFLTKGDDKPTNTAAGQTTSPNKPKPSVPQSGSKSKSPSTSGRPTTTKPGGGGGGGGGDDAEIVDVAEKYADAVNDRNESAAKSLTCDKTDGGVLYESTTSGQKVQVTGKPEMSGGDSAFIDFGVSSGGGEPIDIPILLENKSGWCIAI